MTQLRYKCALFSSARRYVCAFVRPVGFAAGRFFAAKKGHVFVFCHERVFPVNLKKQLSNVYLYTFFSAFTITDAVWVALLAARGFTLAQIGLAGAGLCVLGGAVLLSGLAVAGKTRYNGGRAG